MVRKDGDGGSGGSTKKNTEAGTFTMAISYMPDSLQPDTASDDYTSMVRPIYDPLFFRIRKMELSTTWRTVWRYPKMD